MKKRKLPTFPVEERHFVENASEKEIIGYLQQHVVYKGTETWILQNSSKEVLEELFKQQSLLPQNEELMLKIRSEKIVLSYILRYPLGKNAKNLMVELHMEDAIQLHDKLYGEAKIKEGA